MIGYPEFFSEETKDCDTAHFSFWKGLEVNKAYLTQALRGEMNLLVRELNAQIITAVEAANAAATFGSVRYVSTNEAFQGHRFCEPGVAEPNNSNPDNWFFLLLGDDASEAGNNIATPDMDAPLSLTPQQCDGLLNSESPTLGTELGDYLVCATIEGLSQGLEPSDWITGMVPGGGEAFIPESYAKAFHPKTAGHAAIRRAIEANARIEPAKDLWRVLIMLDGSQAELQTLVDKLPSTAAKSRSKKYEREGIDLRGYATYLTLEEARALRNSNPQVVGYSREKLVLKVDEIAFRRFAQVDVPQRKRDDGVRETNGENHHSNASTTTTTTTISSVVRRQETDTNLDLYAGGSWALVVLSDPPLFQPQHYYSYPGFVNDPNAGESVNIYILDTGVHVTHSVRVPSPNTHFSAALGTTRRVRPFPRDTDC